MHLSVRKSTSSSARPTSLWATWVWARRVRATGVRRRRARRAPRQASRCPEPVGRAVVAPDDHFAPRRCLVLGVWGPLPKALHHLHVCNACTLYEYMFITFSCSVYNVYYTALLRNRWIMSHLAVYWRWQMSQSAIVTMDLCRSGLWARCLLTHSRLIVPSIVYTVYSLYHFLTKYK